VSFLNQVWQPQFIARYQIERFHFSRLNTSTISAGLSPMMSFSNNFLSALRAE
jgi:hypothetical protein